MKFVNEYAVLQKYGTLIKTLGKILYFIKENIFKVRLGKI